MSGFRHGAEQHQQRERHSAMLEQFCCMFSNLDPGVVASVCEAMDYDQDGAIAALENLSNRESEAEQRRQELAPPPAAPPAAPPPDRI
eukprot:gene39536-54142_t